jgi:hypothetical protein
MLRSPSAAAKNARMSGKSAERLYRALAGTFCLVAVGAQYFLVMHGSSSSVASQSVRFFSFFTILSNLLIGLALIVPVLAPNSRAARFLLEPGVRTALTGYIIVVGVVYWALLHDLSKAQGARLIIERALHYVTPPLYVLDWLLFVPKDRLRWNIGVSSLGFPAAYAGWTLAHGAVTGWYPYPFLDVADLGYLQTFLNIGGLVLAFLVLELALVGLSRLVQR